MNNKSLKPTEEVKEAPLFDSSRKALEFALNAVKVKMPSPFMNKAMAEVKVKKRRMKKAGVMAKNATALALLDLEEAPRSSRKPHEARMPTGLEAAAQAGFILRQLDRLEPAHRTVLYGVVITAYDPCECRAPCCSGERLNPRWASAVKETCEILKGVGDITKTAGKRGLSTHPAMRWALVEQFYTKRAIRVADIARHCRVALMTVTKHREWINTYLEQTEQEAWLAVDAIFDQVGITGPAG